jgi:hypothetical protein
MHDHVNVTTHGHMHVKFLNVNFIKFAHQIHNINEQYLFLKALVYVSMFIKHPLEISYYVR